MRTADTVILLHGLARSHRCMGKLEKALQQAGYNTLNINYPSTHDTIESLAMSVINEALQRCPKASNIHFVTHSLGGILLRYYLDKQPIPHLGRVVMLAPPNHGSDISRRLAPFRIIRKLLGPVVSELSSEASSTVNQLGPAQFELGIIAGNRNINPLFALCLNEDNDGTISVDTTRLAGMQDHITLPASHPLIMRNEQVIDQVIFFLENGRFKR